MQLLFIFGIIWTLFLDGSVAVEWGMIWKGKTNSILFELWIYDALDPYNKSNNNRFYHFIIIFLDKNSTIFFVVAEVVAYDWYMLCM